MTTTPATGALTFEEFAAKVADGLRLETTDLRPETTLDGDLGLDSFDLVEVLALVGELGADLPDEVAVELHTMADVHRAYEAALRPPVPDA
ncbi:MAG TPA: phosphopantetheine-binding protein [Acidimicrobiales bacterium]|nr:phosphopantetheine-binding protein [Acidimicrobiales bacterium]